MNEFQQTIKTAVTVAGIGLHTGAEVRMTFHPAPPGHGIKFQRTDLGGEPIIPALVDYVVDISRGTTLERNGAQVNTVEHVLAALVGLQIDNVLIKLNNVETPIMDGSSKVFVEVLSGVGTENQQVQRKYFHIPKELRYYHKGKNVEMIAVPDDDYRVDVTIDYNSKVLGRQEAAIDNIDQFKTEFASSRTFCFLHELEMLVDHNLIRGGDLSNAIVVVDKKVDDEELDRLSYLFNQPKVAVEEGILNNVELRYKNEPARHKLLDVIGDLALVGVPIKGRIKASRPGHETNIEFAKMIRSAFKDQEKDGIPIYDPNKPAVADINVIKNFLPHKYPFLLVDKIVELNEERVIGIKNVTYNENFFMGHFPHEPVMPGVLILEAMAQTGGILVMNTLPDPENYSTYLLKIDKARFKSKVIPGDTLIFDLQLQGPIRRGLCEMRGRAFVGNRLAAQAELMAQVVKKEDLS